MRNSTEIHAAQLAQSWACLCAGSARIARTYSDEASHHLELERSDGQALNARDLELMLPVLLGKAQKVVAVDARRAASSVTFALTRAFRRMGLGCRPNDVPLVAVMSAHAAMQYTSVGLEVGSLVERLQEQAYVLSVPRPEGWLRGVLTPCEWRAVELRIAGSSHDEVARQCGVSARTIANQIASSYRKLGVSGRLELLNRILTDDQVQRSRPGFASPFENQRGGSLFSLGNSKWALGEDRP